MSTENLLCTDWYVMIIRFFKINFMEKIMVKKGLVRLTAVLFTTLSISALAGGMSPSEGLFLNAGQMGQYQNGADLCQQRYSTAATCIPMMNSSSSELRLTIPDGRGVDVDANIWAALVGANYIQSIVFKIKNKITGDVIFEGPVYNKVGVICNDIGCVPWA